MFDKIIYDAEDQVVKKWIVNESDMKNSQKKETNEPGQAEHKEKVLGVFNVLNVEKKNQPEAKKSELATYLCRIMNLPPEISNPIINELDATDFGTLVDIAESKKSFTIALWARSHLTEQ